MGASAMVNRHAPWTIQEIAHRFEEAASTGRRLPCVRTPGYFNAWPHILRQQWEAFATEDRPYRPFPPSPQDVERMLETMRWVLWLEVEQRHLVWMRAKRYGWRDITTRFACDRSTAWRRWHKALEIVAEQLNRDGLRLSSKNLSNPG
ncbi:helix-turn-helix domain-containing protein [Xanthomonas albilineans]